MEREDKRGIFFGVIGVLTLIVAIIGASLAYFSISANSAEDAVIVQAATVQIVYEDGDELLVADGIIPSTKEVALETYRRFLNGETYTGIVGGEEKPIEYKECVDDNGYTVCGVYEFTLTNNGEQPVSITAKVTPTELAEGTTKFVNLKYALYDITDVAEGSTETGTQIGTDNLITYNEFNLMTNPIPLAVKTPTKYRLFIWLNETVGQAQDYEQGAVFKGTIYVNVSGENGNGTITGNADKTIGQ